MSVRYRYGTVSVLYRILRVGIGIIPIPYRYRKRQKVDTDRDRDRYGIGMRSVFGGICSSLHQTNKIITCYTMMQQFLSMTQILNLIGIIIETEFFFFFSSNS
ncbi:hypothetical protein Hanom_Chr03g00248011 [Helianthus anomalus]